MRERERDLHNCAAMNSHMKVFALGRI